MERRLALGVALSLSLSSFALSAAEQTPAGYFERNGLLGVWSRSCNEPATATNQHFSYTIDDVNVILRVLTARQPDPSRGYLLITQARQENDESFALTLQIILLRPNGQPAPPSTTMNQTWRRLSADRMQLWRAVTQPGGAIPLARPRVDVDDGLNQDDQSPSITVVRCA